MRKTQTARGSKTKAYSAGTTDAGTMDKVIRLLEGRLQGIRERRPDEDNENQDTRPKAMPVVYVAGVLGCSTRTFNKWLAFHRDRREDVDVCDRFCEVYDLLCNELAEVVSSKTFVIATDPGNTQSLRAQMYLLPKMDPEVYGESSDEERQALQVADFPPELFDVMTDEDRAELGEHAAEHDRRIRKIDDLITRLKARAAQEDPDEDR